MGEIKQIIPSFDTDKHMTLVPNIFWECKNQYLSCVLGKGEVKGGFSVLTDIHQTVIRSLISTVPRAALAS